MRIRAETYSRNQASERLDSDCKPGQSSAYAPNKHTGRRPRAPPARGRSAADRPGDFADFVDRLAQASEADDAG